MKVDAPGLQGARELYRSGNRAEALERMRDLVTLSGSMGDGEAIRNTWREIADVVAGRSSKEEDESKGRPGNRSGKGRPSGK